MCARRVDTCKSVNTIRARLCSIDVCHKAREAPNAVAAHLWLAAIAVENAHAVVGVIAVGRQCKDDTVTTNAKVAVTQAHCLLLGDEWLGGMPVVHLL